MCVGGTVVGGLEIAGEDREIPRSSVLCRAFRNPRLVLPEDSWHLLFLSKSCILTCLRGILDPKKRDEGMAVAL